MTHPTAAEVDEVGTASSSGYGVVASPWTRVTPDPGAHPVLLRLSEFVFQVRSVLQKSVISKKKRVSN